MTDNVHIVTLGSSEQGSYIREVLSHPGIRIQPVETIWDALSLMRAASCDILVAELPFGESDGEELLSMARENSPECLTVFRVPSSRVVEAVGLIRRGAYSCFDEQTPDSEVTGILNAAVLEVESRRAATRERSDTWRRMLVGESPQMQEVAATIELVASRRCTVLISGETGTGKEICARAIHAASDRSRKPMVALNCSAIPEHLLEAELFGHTRGAFTGAINERIGRFEEANEGTLFLDEIGDMPFDLQAKLLRVLQEREIQRLGSSKTIKVNVRIIAASNLDLLERVRQGRFREDLYYRLNVVPIKMPALRERPGDIALLARHFVERVCRVEGIERKEIYNETLARLARCDWPGNVRQLENLVERAVIISGTRAFLVPGDFPFDSPFRRPAASETPAAKMAVPDQGIDFAQTVTIFEKNLLDQALSKSRGNKSLAAGLLGLKRSTLISKLRVLEQVAA